MEFPDLGKRCAVASCKLLDFLPFVCEQCKGVYCLEHRSFDKHNCSFNLAAKNKLPTCALCSKTVLVGANESPDVKMDEHIRSGCRKHLLQRTPRRKCGLKGCSNEENNHTVECAKCHGEFCLPHRHATDHACPALQARDTGHMSAPGQALLKRLQKQRAEGGRQKPRKRYGAKGVERLQQQRRARAAAATRGSHASSDTSSIRIMVCLSEGLARANAKKPQNKLVSVSTQWSVGRALDSVCDEFAVRNRNNEAHSRQIVLSEQEGNVLSSDMRVSQLGDKVLVLRFEGEKREEPQGESKE